MRIFTIGHGIRPAEELVECLAAAGVKTLVDVRRYPGSRRNPQFGRDALTATLGDAGFTYLHAADLGGRLSGEPGADEFSCIRVAAFRSYVARMTGSRWQSALAEALAQPSPCLMCAETDWRRCHRRLIADLLAARGHEVVHLLRPHQTEPHRLSDEAEVSGGKLHYCGRLVA